MAFIYETHAHTAEVSRCGRVPAADVVRRYVDVGYDGIVITDHFSRATFQKLGDCPWQDKVDFFLQGYRIACATAADEAPNFHVLPGLELRLDCDEDNDFLLFGADEDFLYRSEGLLQMTFEQMAQYVHDNGLLLVQAHPFRECMCIVDWNLLDGMEVYNGNPNHESNNPIANLWTQRHGLLQTSGSDYHGQWGEHLGGVCLETPATDSRQFAEALRSGQYTLVYQET